MILIEEARGVRHTYFNNGRRVSDQTMALMPPMTSSSDGTLPDAGQIPFRTYKGDVPMSEYIIPD